MSLGHASRDHSAAEAGRVVNRAAEADMTRVTGTCQPRPLCRGGRQSGEQSRGGRSDACRWDMSAERTTRRARPAARGASCLPAAEPSDGIDTRRPPLTSDHDGGGQRASTPVSSVSSDMGANERRHAPLIRRQAATRPAGRPSSGRH